MRFLHKFLVRLPSALVEAEVILSVTVSFIMLCI